MSVEDDEPETQEPPERAGSEPTVIARTSTRLAVPIIFLTAVALLLQGHNEPGGGFIAGVLAVSGFALVYIVFGVDYVESELVPRRPLFGEPPAAEIRKEFTPAVALGLGLAVSGGLAAILLGFPFLTQAVAFVKHVPLYGEIELASALIFDLGVFIVVVGGLMTILAVVGDQ
ncbi:MAG: MnhB domain-containing protein [Salinirussus sp.]